MSPALIALVLTVLFVAALTKATIGFGESLLAIPLLTFVVGIQIASPLVSLMAASVTLLIIGRSWQRIDLNATWRLIAAAVVGVPAGVWGLKTLPEAWMTAVLGTFLILAGLYHLLRPTLRALHGEHWTYLFGFLSGLFGGAYNMGSPPLIVYGAMRRWSPEQFRASLQSVFLPISVLILAGHASAGLWTTDVLQLFALSLPVVLLAFWLGDRLSQRISPGQFERVIYVCLVILGVLLLI